MAGYIMTIGADEYLDMFYQKTKSGTSINSNAALSQEEGRKLAKRYALEQCILNGTYSAKTAEKGAAFIGTLADYLGMKTGDDIFFFTERKIYGIGRLIKIADTDCRFRILSNDLEKDFLTEERNPDIHKFTCTFEPAPYFFKIGVDMDEVLTFSPEKIKSLRFFSKMTFIKLDDIESEAIKNVIARKNEKYLDKSEKDKHFEFSERTHLEMTKKIKSAPNAYKLSVFDYLQYKNNKNNGNVSSEYYIEGAIMDLLRDGKGSEILGKWDFIGRQYPASPPKPSQYEETMDLFGYRYVPGFPNAISKYLVIELKVGTINKDHVQQTMKYVDWISREYAKGDYSMIEAYTIGYDKEDGIEEMITDITERNYIIEGHPVESRKWQELRILSYRTLLKELAEKQNREYGTDE